MDTAAAMPASDTAAAMMPGPPHRVSKILAGSLRVSLTRALEKQSRDQLEEVRALLEQGADPGASMVQFMPKTSSGYFFYLHGLCAVTRGPMLSVLIDGGWRRERIAEFVEQMEIFKTSMYSVPDELQRKWSGLPDARAPSSRTNFSNLDVHNGIILRLQGAMPSAMSEADERARAASSRVVPPGIDNASEVVLDAPRSLSATDTGADASFLLGYFDLQASRVWAPEEQPGAGAELRCTFYAVNVREVSRATQVRGCWTTPSNQGLTLGGVSANDYRMFPVFGGLGRMTTECARYSPEFG